MKHFIKHLKNTYNISSHMTVVDEGEKRRLAGSNLLLATFLWKKCMKGSQEREPGNSLCTWLVMCSLIHLWRQWVRRPTLGSFANWAKLESVWNHTHSFTHSTCIYVVLAAPPSAGKLASTLGRCAWSSHTPHLLMIKWEKWVGDVRSQQ